MCLSLLHSEVTNERLIRAQGKIKRITINIVLQDCSVSVHIAD
jgi:hypothetical protein